MTRNPPPNTTLVKAGEPLAFVKICPVCAKSYDKTEVDGLECERGHLWFNCWCGTTLMILKEKRVDLKTQLPLPSNNL